MRLITLPILAVALATIVSAQDSAPQVGGGAECTLCLQNGMRTLPLCKNLNITIGDFNPNVSNEYAACLCSSLDGAWIDGCKDPTKCGADIEAFKASYAQNIKQAGLDCTSTPTFSAPPPDPVAPSTAPPTSAATGGADGAKSEGLPSMVMTKTMGALAVIAAVGAAFI